MKRSLLKVAVASALLAPALASCTTEVEVASLPKAAETFVHAWLSQDAPAMVEGMEQEAASAWTPANLHKWLDQTFDHGSITLFEIETARVRQPEVSSEEELKDLAAEVDYTITYSSRSTEEPAALEGALRFVYEDGAWGADWNASRMWPGIPGAVDFAVDIKDSRRAPILDRRGKVLAEGDGADRTYPFGSIGGTTVGHIAPVSKKDATEGREAGDLVGASGLEKSLDDRLDAASGSELLVVNKRGKTLESLGSKEAGQPEPVKVTLDMRVQRAAQAAYGGTTGGAVVMDPETGDLLAVVSSSPFNPNSYVGVDTHPFNRALSGTYPPGSSMKVVTASAAIEEGIVTPETMITGPSDYKGVHNFDSGSYGSIPFLLATQKSVNTAFAQVAEDLGAKKMTEYATKFGFNKTPSMPLETATSSFPKPEDLSDLMWGSIGQAQVLATPLEMATVAATVANDGTRMEPRILLDTPPQGKEAIMPETAKTMTELMEAVVRGGTGTAANLGTPTVAGKTGTAEVQVGGEIQNHAWFICFAPSDDPTVAVAVVAEFGGIGGEVAAPLAREILQAVLPLVK